MGQGRSNRSSVEMPHELVLTQWLPGGPWDLVVPLLAPSLTGASAERPVVADADQEQGRAALRSNGRLRNDTDPTPVSSTAFTAKN